MNKLSTASQFKAYRKGQFYAVLRNIKIGRYNSRASTENRSPTMVPMAKLNQNTSAGPSIKKGRRPKTVDAIVRKIGRIFRL